MSSSDPTINILYKKLDKKRIQLCVIYFRTRLDVAYYQRDIFHLATVYKLHSD